MDKGEIKSIAVVLAVVLAIVFGSNMHRIHELNKEINLEKVNVSRLEEEVRSLQSDVHELESENDKLNDDCCILFGDADRMWKTEAYICCVFKDGNYYHRPFLCSWEEEAVVDVCLKSDAEKLGYSPCPDCYKKIYGKLEAD